MYLNLSKIPRYVIVILIVLVSIICAALMVEIIKADYDEKVTCKLFKSQAEAQQQFELEPKRLKSLDRDKDGIACEALL